MKAMIMISIYCSNTRSRQYSDNEDGRSWMFWENSWTEWGKYNKLYIQVSIVSRQQLQEEKAGPPPPPAPGPRPHLVQNPSFAEMSRHHQQLLQQLSFLHNNIQVSQYQYKMCGSAVSLCVQDLIWQINKSSCNFPWNVFAYCLFPIPYRAREPWINALLFTQ